MNCLFYAPALAAYGGLERHICTLAAAIAAQGHSICILTTGNSLGPELRQVLAHPRITLRELPRPRGAAGPVRKSLWLLKELLAARRRPWDVIYTNGQSGLARFVWAAAGRKSRIVHHHHTAGDEAEQATWSRTYRHVLRRAPLLIGCSRATCTALRTAVDCEAQFLPYLTSGPVGSGLVHDRPARPALRFGFCGRLIPEKGIETILALAADGTLADIEWHIHGSGAAFPPERFAGRARVTAHGAYHSATEHAAILLGLDALVLFSTHNEGMPLSLIEGMSAGLPWIATDRGGTRELAVSDADCVVAPASAGLRELRGSVRLLADRILAGATYRSRQRAAYDKRFAPAVVTRQWEALFGA